MAWLASQRSFVSSQVSAKRTLLRAVLHAVLRAASVLLKVQNVGKEKDRASASVVAFVVIREAWPQSC